MDNTPGSDFSGVARHSWEGEDRQQYRWRHPSTCWMQLYCTDPFLLFLFQSWPRPGIVTNCYSIAAGLVPDTARPKGLGIVPKVQLGQSVDDVVVGPEAKTEAPSESVSV